VGEVDGWKGGEEARSATSRDVHPALGPCQRSTTTWLVLHRVCLLSKAVWIPLEIETFSTLLTLNVLYVLFMGLLCIYYASLEFVILKMIAYITHALIEGALSNVKWKKIQYFCLSYLNP